MTTKAVRKSGSLRGMAPRPNTATDCGTPMLDHLLTAAGQRLRFADGNEIGFRGQAAEDVVDELSKFGRRDIADRNDLEVIAGKRSLVIGREIIVRDARDRRHRPIRRTGVGMAGEGLRIPFALRDFIGVLVGIGEVCQQLLTDADDRVGIKAWALHRKLQQFDRLVAVDAQRLEGAVDGVLAVLVLHAHGEFFHALLVVLGFEITGALIHHRGEEVGDAFLADGVLTAAAVESVSQCHHRNAVLFDEPSFNSAGRLDLLNVHSGGRIAG